MKPYQEKQSLCICSQCSNADHCKNTNYTGVKEGKGKNEKITNLVHMFDKTNFQTEYEYIQIPRNVTQTSGIDSSLGFH